MPEHVDIVDPEIHEPKGIATALVDKVYVADGAGAGAWKTVHVAGSEDDNNTLSALSLATGPTKTYLTNNSLGAFTTSVNRLPGRTDVWDPVGMEFDWTDAGYQIGDHIEIRVDVNITTTGANRTINSAIELAIGGTAYELDFDQLEVKTAGTINNYIVRMKFDLGDTNTLENTGKIFMHSDGAGDSVFVNGWRIFINPKHALFD